jgi:hypothetical protein
MSMGENGSSLTGMRWLLLQKILHLDNFGPESSSRTLWPVKKYYGWKNKMLHKTSGFFTVEKILKYSVYCSLSGLSSVHQNWSQSSDTGFRSKIIQV